MMNKMRVLRGLDILKFVKINFFTRHVQRDKNAFIFPYKGSVFSFEKNARIILHAHLTVNADKMGISREQAFIRLRSGSEFTVLGNTSIASRASVQLQKDARLAVGRSAVNHEACIIADSSITIGEGVLISRNVTIFDSDFHKILDEDGSQTNQPAAVVIGNHVWIGAGASILRGSRIGNGAVISAGSVVMGKVKEGSLAMGFPARSFSSVKWEE